MCLERSSGFFVAMSCEVVENNGGAWRDLRDQDLLHIGRKGRTVHCALDHPRCDQGLVGQPRNQGLGTPTAKGRIHRQAFATRGPSAQPGEVRFDRCFIKKDNAFWHPRNGWQAVCEPILTSPPHLGAAAFGSDQ